MTNALTNIRPIRLTKTQAIACGIRTDLVNQTYIREIVLELGLEILVGITHQASAKFLNMREILSALKIALPFASAQTEAYLEVRSNNGHEPSVRLKALREFNEVTEWFTIMTPDEFIS